MSRASEPAEVARGHADTVASARLATPSSCFRCMMKCTTLMTILVNSNGSRWNRYPGPPRTVDAWLAGAGRHARGDVLLATLWIWNAVAYHALLFTTSGRPA